MARVTEDQLSRTVEMMARVIGAPDGPAWIKFPDGTVRARVGALVLEPGSRTYGRAWKVCRLVNEGGGEHALLSAGSAADLRAAIFAYLEGYRDGRVSAGGAV